MKHQHAVGVKTGIDYYGNNIGMVTLFSLWPFLLVSFVLVVSGCSSLPQTYDPIADSGFKGPNLEQVKRDPSTWQGSRIRWGGTIVDVENRRKETWIEILGYPLTNRGRPSTSRTSEGRFIARFAGFLDPAVYDEDKPITVIGNVEDSVKRTIGDYPYRFPTVAVDSHKLWQQYQEPEVIYYYPDLWWNSRLWHHRFHFGYPWPHRYRYH